MINDKECAGEGARRILSRGVGRLLSLSFIIYHLSFSVAIGQTQTGIASFYSKKATGARTANGERLHHDSLTCAHRTLPFGTRLKVTCPTNGRAVVVRVNDRGPFRKGRIIDLSWGAAKEIGMISQGIVPVTVEKVSEAIIPLKPEDDSPEVPKFEFEIADIAVSGIEPVWRQDQLSIDHKKVQDSMKRTAERSADKASAQTDNIR